MDNGSRLVDAGVMRQVADSWRAFGPAFGEYGLPPNYVAFDIETTGFSADAVPTQIGWVIVRDGETVAEEVFILDWYTHPPATYEAEVFRKWLDEQLYTVGMDFQKMGAEYPVDLARMRAEGLPPRTVFDLVYEVLTNATSSGFVVAGHTVAKFDLARISSIGTRVLGLSELSIPPESILDIAGADAAFTLGAAGDARGSPAGAKSAIEYFHRVSRVHLKGTNRQVGRKQSEIGASCGFDPLAVHHALEDAKRVRDIIETWRGHIRSIAGSFADPLLPDRPVPETLIRTRAGHVLGTQPSLFPEPEYTPGLPPATVRRRGVRRA